MERRLLKTLARISERRLLVCANPGKGLNNMLPRRCEADEVCLQYKAVRLLAKIEVIGTGKKSSSINHNP
jgi:hypothetical protein